MASLRRSRFAEVVWLQPSTGHGRAPVRRRAKLLSYAPTRIAYKVRSGAKVATVERIVDYRDLRVTPRGA